MSDREKQTLMEIADVLNGLDAAGNMAAAAIVAAYAAGKAAGQKMPKEAS